jgi:hypothetical protein
VDAYITGALERQPAERRAQARQQLESMQVPPRFPATLGVASLNDGSVILFRFERPGEELVGEIMLLSPDGELEARIDDWEGMEPWPRGLGTVLVRGEDELGAPRVTRHRFARIDGGRN